MCIRDRPKIEEVEEEDTSKKEKKKKKVKEVTHEWDLMNKQKPIWTRKPEEVTKEEYGAFCINRDVLDSYDVFISYRHGDNDTRTADALFDLATNFTVGSTAREVRVYLDAERMAGGVGLAMQAASAVATSLVVVPLLTEKIAAAKRKAGAGQLIAQLTHQRIDVLCGLVGRVQKLGGILTSNAELLGGFHQGRNQVGSLRLTEQLFQSGGDRGEARCGFTADSRSIAKDFTVLAAA